MRLVVDGLIFQKDPHGGIARYFREILPRMCEQEPQLQVTLFTDGPVLAEIPHHPQIHLRQAPAVHRTFRPKGLSRQLFYPLRRLGGFAWNNLRQLWLSGETEAIWHSTFYTTPAAWKGPQVVTLHDLIPERFPDQLNDPMDHLGRRQKLKAVQQARALICVSQATRDDFRRIYPDVDKQIFIVKNGYSSVFRLLETSNQADLLFPFIEMSDQPFLLYVGGRALYKNFASLLQAYRAWGQRSNIRLAVVGSPWTAAEQDQLDRDGLTSRLVHLGYLKDADLCRAYNQAAGLVFPSLAEGFGIPLLEAMACGCPIVASAIPSTLEVAADVPIYFDPADPSTLIPALDRLIAEGRDSARSQAGLQRVQQFSWDKTASETLQVYRSLADNAHASVS